jgi:hypothetical protein
LTVGDSKRFPSVDPNPAASVDAPITRLLALDYQWWRATDPRRWVI